jgi:hypothetical protein
MPGPGIWGHLPKGAKWPWVDGRPTLRAWGKRAADLRGNARGSEEMAAVPAAGPRLLRELLEDWAWGNLSAANVVRYSRAAAAPGPQSC